MGMQPIDTKYIALLITVRRKFLEECSAINNRNSTRRVAPPRMQELKHWRD